jgi:hypothetical protein
VVGVVNLSLQVLGVLGLVFCSYKLTTNLWKLIFFIKHSEELREAHKALRKEYLELYEEYLVLCYEKDNFEKEYDKLMDIIEGREQRKFDAKMEKERAEYEKRTKELENGAYFGRELRNIPKD